MEKHEIINEMPELAKSFAAYKSGIQGCSPKTVENYLFDLRIFFRYLIVAKKGVKPSEENTENIKVDGVDLEFVKSITTEDIYGFLLYTGDVRENNWSAKSRKLSAIKAFFRYLTVKRNLLSENPAADIESPKRKKTLPKFLTYDESVKLLETAWSDVESKSRERDYAMLTLFLNCGMRLSELVGIDLNDIDRELRSLRVTGKGSKERVIYLNEACVSALAAYLKIRLSPEERKSGENALFLSKQHRRISNQMVQKIVYKYLDAAGLGNRNFSVHKLRHTAATLMYQSGNVDVRVLKDILGHEQLNTTQIYTHVSDASMERAVRENPLSKITDEPITDKTVEKQRKRNDKLKN